MQSQSQNLQSVQEAQDPCQPFVYNVAVDSNGMHYLIRWDLRTSLATLLETGNAIFLRECQSFVDIIVLNGKSSIAELEYAASRFPLTPQQSKWIFGRLETLDPVADNAPVDHVTPRCTPCLDTGVIVDADRVAFCTCEAGTKVQRSSARARRPLRIVC